MASGAWRTGSTRKALPAHGGPGLPHDRYAVSSRRGDAESARKKAEGRSAGDGMPQNPDVAAALCANKTGRAGGFRRKDSAGGLETEGSVVQGQVPETYRKRARGRSHKGRQETQARLGKGASQSRLPPPPGEKTVKRRPRSERKMTCPSARREKRLPSPEKASHDVNRDSGGREEGKMASPPEKGATAPPPASKENILCGVPAGASPRGTEPFSPARGAEKGQGGARKTLFPLPRKPRLSARLPDCHLSDVHRLRELPADESKR